MKLKRLFSGLLVSLIAIVSVLLCVKVSNAEEITYDYTFPSKVFKANSTKKLGDLSWTLSGAGGYWGYDSKKGQQFGSSNKPYKSLALETNQEISNVKKVIVTASTGSDASAKIALSVGDSTSNQFTMTDSNNDYTFTLDSQTTGNVKIEMTQTSSKALYIKRIKIVHEKAAAPTYNVSFDANGFDFIEGKGETITTESAVTLPVIGDLANAVKGYSLIGWSDGTNTRKPGETVAVNANTKYTAVYEEDNSKVLSVKEAIALYDFLGKKTTKEFKVTGVISAFDKDYPNNITIVDETDNTKELKLTDPAIRVSDTKVVVGDKIIGNGYITKHNSTYELDYNCTYTNVSTKEDMFQRVETMSSLSFDWATTDGETYTVSNVSLRFGNLFRAVAFDSNAQYGVFVIKSSVLGTSTVEQYLSGKTLEEITADTEIINVEATPVKVNAQGVADEKGKYYQFAAVLSDMDEYLTTSITAVMYVVIDGQIYYSVEKTASVQSTAYAYFNDDALMDTLDKDVKNVILKLATLE